MKRVVFIGSSRFGLRCLDAIRCAGSVQISGILTTPKRFSISYAPKGVSLSTYADFQSYAKTYNLPCHCMAGPMTSPEVFDFIGDRAPDCMIVAGWYHLLPNAILDIAPAYGLHASLLPDYSGGAPLVWAMINGEVKTGITLFQMKSGVDNGPVVGSFSTEIKHLDTIATLYDRIEDLGIALLDKHLPSLADGTVVTSIQDESDRRIYPQRTPDDGEIDWTSSPEELYNFIRAQTRPYPGAYTHYRGEKVTVWSSELIGVSTEVDFEPGTVWRDSDDVVLVCCGSQKCLKLVSIEFRGGEYEPAKWFEHFIPERDTSVRFGTGA